MPVLPTPYPALRLGVEAQRDFSPAAAGEWPEGPRGRGPKGRKKSQVTYGRARWFVVSLLMLVATPAAALTCAPPDMTPDELVAADLKSPRGNYDLAVVGEVVSVTTDMSEGDTHGQTFVQMSVVGVFGSTSSGRAFVATTPDPGRMSGYPFEEGMSYFVPVLTSGPGGEVNYVHACDPVEELADAEAAAARLANVAAENGIDYTFPIVGGGSGALVTVLFVVLLGGLLFWTGKKRQASRRELYVTGSDARPGRTR